ncbi:hypothetical protein P171DRAFT_197082 [Karstenula rhodostoma CBS 690.94]|uniref:Uncharacterized protein n=1 Tax=Karstenula rhodostoma CBS 690.94 TaxID=1392251 RepID=A0A9P4PVF5_9PLEO|nr:hypothetical protein P171DRAFT_197082 [Karstenula rhodostoma CBS 690.94]
MLLTVTRRQVMERERPADRDRQTNRRAGGQVGRRADRQTDGQPSKSDDAGRRLPASHVARCAASTAPLPSRRRLTERAMPVAGRDLSIARAGPRSSPILSARTGSGKLAVRSSRCFEVYTFARVKRPSATSKARRGRCAGTRRGTVHGADVNNAGPSSSSGRGAPVAPCLCASVSRATASACRSRKRKSNLRQNAKVWLR